MLVPSLPFVYASVFALFYRILFYWCCENGCFFIFFFNTAMFLFRYYLFFSKCSYYLLMLYFLFFGDENIKNVWCMVYVLRVTVCMRMYMWKYWEKIHNLNECIRLNALCVLVYMCCDYVDDDNVTMIMMLL